MSPEEFKTLMVEVAEWEEAIVDMHVNDVEIPKICSRKMHEAFDNSLNGIAQCKKEGISELNMAAIILEVMAEKAND